MAFSKYFLSKHSFICEVQSYWVVLNVKDDKYLCIPSDEVESVAPWLHGFSIATTQSDKSKVVNYPVIDSLISNGVITSNSECGKPFIQENICSPTRSLPLQDCNFPVSLSSGTLAAFILACISTEWRLRRHSIINILDRIEKQKLRTGSPVKGTDEQVLANLQHTFSLLRPIYPRPYLCLFDSLALLEFFRHFHLFPHIVFGVVAEPFQAHCWLQQDCLVINDDLERLGSYTPILAK